MLTLSPIFRCPAIAFSESPVHWAAQKWPLVITLRLRPESDTQLNSSINLGGTWPKQVGQMRKLLAQNNSFSGHSKRWIVFSV